ncbi:hypothetical protein Esi_0058_0063 [Ectocarpus siliculosus]|uniref:Uncharacterized protein n=1 Tax=Ectocarpus siliculosus TaxID=2880 RepID=D7G4T2_ECTSI|nr:hypothetical protein Esi_0058_0063 [Ectocarpus siliculosus]|eukprot:CBJ27175.1 hypothetical protein Esi_0058_0063 [Ectocarpus siliculosus]
MSGAQGGEGAGPIGEGAPSANGDRDSVDDVIERLLSVRENDHTLLENEREHRHIRQAAAMQLGKLVAWCRKAM